MPTQPIIVYSGKKDTESDKLAKVIMMEKMGQGIAGASEMLNKGIESYQRIKANKQGQDLAAITAASALVGGPDKLPVETRNKLPGILNIDLPRDAEGNVVLTPSAQDTLNRAVAEAAKSDPGAFGRVKAGMQEAAPSPEEVAVRLEGEKTTRQGKILEYQTKEAERAADAAEKAADRAERERANIRTTTTQKEVAEIKGPTSAAARAVKGSEPSDFWVDLKTGDTLSKPAAEISLEPGQKLEDKYWNPTNDALKQHNEGRRAKAQADRSKSNTELDKSRKELIEARVKQVGAKDPDKLKFIMDGLNDAQKLKKAGASNADEVIKYWTNEWIKALGQEAKPEEYGWMAQMLDYTIEKGRALLELGTGRGSTANVEAATPKPTAETATRPVKSTEVPGGKKTVSVDEWLK